MHSKEMLKQTGFYRYYKCIKDYKKFKKDTGFVSALFSVKMLGYSGRENKISQLETAFEKVEISNCGHGNFFYSIDERVRLLDKGRVIGNMPANYQMIIGNSINDLEKALCNGSEIGIQNARVLNVFKKYIDRAIESDSSASVLKEIVNKKAETLEEALQRILFVNQFLWQTGHQLIGLGRLDKLLVRFPETDNEEQIIKDFLLTLHEHYHFKSSEMPGDTGQIILLGGKEPDGSYYSDRLTYRFIKCLHDLKLPDPKILLRVSSDVPDDLLDIAVKTIATGIGSPLLSNDDVIIDKLIGFGYTEEDAYGYGVSACWEPLAIGKSLEQNNIGSVEFGMAIHNTIEDKKFLLCEDLNQVKELFFAHLDICIQRAVDEIDSIIWERDPIFTLFTAGCLEKNLDISEGGAVYNDYGLLSEGMSSAVDSLLNINTFCFVSKKYSLKEVRDAIMNNYAGCGDLEQDFRKNADGFGTDSDEAISLTNSILGHTDGILLEYRNKFGGKVKYGLSSPMYIVNGQRTGATADGRKEHVPFATHISREHGESPTSIIRFASALNYKPVNCNANVIDYMMTPNLMISETDKFVTLLKAAIRTGLFQIQFNVTSYSQLLAAREHPELYPDLIVRVWGFSAYFNDLPDDYKDALIERAKNNENIA